MSHAPSCATPVRLILGPAKLTNIVWRMIISKRSLHINFFIKITIEKGISHIHLENIPKMHRSHNEGWDKSKVSHRRKSWFTKTHTWDFVDLPLNKTAVGCKWVYKIKTKFDGFVEQYKAHLVAKGFNQKYGIDYDETFAPVACLTYVWSLLVVASTCHCDLFQMDVKMPFLMVILVKKFICILLWI